MDAFQVRWQQFKGFRDSDWAEIRPLTLLIGPNNSGKSSFISPLLLMKQTLSSSDTDGALNTKGPIANDGSFRDLVHRHHVEQEVNLTIRFASGTRYQTRQSAFGHSGVVEVSMSFVPGDYPGDINLSEYQLRDVAGRVAITRRRNRDGGYSLKGWERYARAQQDAGPPWRQRTRDPDPPRSFRLPAFVRNVRPSHFRFTGNDVINALVAGGQRDADIGLIFNYVTLLDGANDLLESALDGLSYVGPLREPFRRIYEVSGEMPQSVGVRGEFAPEILFKSDRSKADSSMVASTNEWLRNFGLNSELVIDQKQDDSFRLQLRGRGKIATNVADVGFGLSQVLPLIVQAFASRDAGLIVAEQPEIHLNPRLQGVLGDLFAEMVNSGKSVLAETHSEHLLLRVRTLIAQGDLDASDVSILFIRNVNGESKVTSIPVDELGHIDLDDWPEDFFEDSLRGALALATAQMTPRAD